jgi:hypothetical protein
VWSVCTLLYRGYIKALSFIHSFIVILYKVIIYTRMESTLEVEMDVALELDIDPSSSLTPTVLVVPEFGQVNLCFRVQKDEWLFL